MPWMPIIAEEQHGPGPEQLRNYLGWFIAACLVALVVFGYFAFFW